jgi:hypothetical protein
LFITHDAPKPAWQLGTPSSETGAFALIGWRGNDRDGGVPEAVTNALARSLAAFGRVTFACSIPSMINTPGWQKQNGDFTFRYRARSILGRMAARFSSRAATDLTLVSTTDEQVVRRLFDDAGYPWWGQGQFALVSAASASLPDLDKIEFDPAALFESEWPEAFVRLRPQGVLAMLRPGVDGDVAGLLCASSELRDRFEAILARHAGEFGTSLRYVSETEFGGALASSPIRE